MFANVAGGHIVSIFVLFQHVGALYVIVRRKRSAKQRQDTFFSLKSPLDWARYFHQVKYSGLTSFSIQFYSCQSLSTVVRGVPIAYSGSELFYVIFICIFH